MSNFTLPEWIQQIETEIAASKVHNHFFRKEIANGIVSGIKIEMIEKGIQKLEWLKELQKYKDLEEQGRLIELPCAKGTTVYLVYKYDDEILKLFSNEPKYYIIKTTFKEFLFSSFGDTVFLTKAEAEAKLAELKGE